MSDAMKAPATSLKHQIEDVLRDTQTLNGLKIEGLNHKVTAFTRAPLLLEQALARIDELERGCHLLEQTELLDQLKDATRQCSQLAALLREAMPCVEWSYTTGVKGGDLLDRIEAALAGQLPDHVRDATKMVTPADHPEPSLDMVRGQLNRRSMHTLLALADTLEQPTAESLTQRRDGQTYVTTSMLRKFAGELPEAWRMASGDWHDERVALHGPHGHITSGLTIEQARAIIDARGGQPPEATASAGEAL